MTKKKKTIIPGVQRCYALTNSRVDDYQFDVLNTRILLVLTFFHRKLNENVFTSHVFFFLRKSLFTSHVLFLGKINKKIKSKETNLSQVEPLENEVLVQCITHHNV